MVDSQMEEIIYLCHESKTRWLPRPVEGVRFVVFRHSDEIPALLGSHPTSSLEYHFGPTELADSRNGTGLEDPGVEAPLREKTTPTEDIGGGDMSKQTVRGQTRKPSYILQVSRDCQMHLSHPQKNMSMPLALSKECITAHLSVDKVVLEVHLLRPDRASSLNAEPRPTKWNPRVAIMSFAFLRSPAPYIIVSGAGKDVHISNESKFEETPTKSRTCGFRRRTFENDSNKVSFRLPVTRKGYSRTS